MADQRTCLSPNCGVTVEGNLTKCPRCGWMMRSPANIRMRGKALIVTGLFLVLFMIGFALYLLPDLVQPGTIGAAAGALLMAGVIAAFIMLGLFIFIGGIQMRATGRPSPFGRLLLRGAVAFIAIGAVLEGIAALIGLIDLI